MFPKTRRFVTAVVVVVAVVCGYAVFSALHDLGGRVNTLEGARDALASLCQKPENKHTAACENPQPGQPGAQGVRGPRGFQGVPGRDGKDGLNGKDGHDGQNGSDSTVPGPAGPTGAPGADSTVPGPAGPKGDPGETCPAGTSLQETQVMTSLVSSTTIYACR